MNRFIQLNRPSHSGPAQRQAQGLLHNGRTGINAGPARLGESVRQLFEGRLQDRLIKSQAVSEIWNQILPKELEGHCSIEQIKDGLLKVQADLPCYAYQFRLCSAEILTLLREACPSAKIKKIKVTVRPAAQA